MGDLFRLPTMSYKLIVEIIFHERGGWKWWWYISYAYQQYHLRSAQDSRGSNQLARIFWICFLLRVRLHVHSRGKVAQEILNKNLRRRNAERIYLFRLHRCYQSHAVLSAQAARTGYTDVVVKTTDIYFPQFWGLESQISRRLQALFLTRACFLACKWEISCWVLTWRGKGSSDVSSPSYKDTYPTMEPNPHDLM